MTSVAILSLVGLIAAVLQTTGFYQLNGLIWIVTNLFVLTRELRGSRMKP